ncbi:hypothetical protein ACTXT7_017018, partial [Hymenolepis weldensis]
TPSPIDLNKLLRDLRDKDDEIRHQALNEIEKLQKEDLTDHQSYFITALIELFKQYRTNKNSCIRIGCCIAKHLIYQRNTAFQEQWEIFLEILGIKLTKAKVYFAESYLKVIAN